MINEQQALQNAANNIGLIIEEYYFEDKRKKVKKYIAVRGKTLVSPPLSYEYLNMFLLGWVKGIDNN